MLFIDLMLTGFVTWSRLWVLSPLWLGFVMLVIVAISIVSITNQQGESCQTRPRGPGSLLSGEVPHRPPPPLLRKTAD